MKASDAEILISTIKGLIEDGEPARVEREIKPIFTLPGGEAPSPRERLNADEKERLYQEFKARLIDDARIDPILLHLLTIRPEIVGEVEPRTVTLDGTSVKGRVARLMAQGWFAGPCQQRFRG
jgi:hypothetical protein